MMIALTTFAGLDIKAVSYLLMGSTSLTMAPFMHSSIQINMIWTALRIT